VPEPRLNPYVRNLLIVATFGVAIWGYVELVRPNVFPKRFGVVEPGAVYRSGKLTPAAFDKVVREHDIKTIIDLGAWEEGSRGDLLAERTAESLGVTRYRFDLVGDGTGNPNAYLDTLRIATDPERQPVLIHCGAGTERTGAAVVFYRTIVQGRDLEAALDEARAAGHSDSRNPKWRRVIQHWYEPIERAFDEGGSVEGAEPVPDPRPVTPPSEG